MKRILSALVVFMLVFSVMPVAYADEITSQTDSEPTTGSESVAEQNPTYVLTLEQAIDMAEAYSPTLEICDVNKKNLQIQLKSAMIAKKDSKNAPVYVNSNFELAFVKQGYYVEAINAQIALSDFDKTKKLSQLAYDVTQKYFSLKSAENFCVTAENALARALENEKIVKTQFDLGMCTALAVDGVSLSVEQCRANVESCKNNVELAKESLKIVLGIEEDCNFVLTDSLEETVLTADLEKDIETALASRYDVNALKTASQLAERYLGIAGSLDEESTTYYSAYTSYKQSVFDYTTGKKNIVLAVKNSYYSACNSINQTNLAKKHYELVKTEYDACKIKAEIGMITNNELVEKADELTECENTYENALLNQKLAVEKYYYDIKIGL